jgi:hypothetical protein
MLNGKLKLVKSPKDNIEQNVEEKISTRTTKMVHLERSGGPKSKCVSEGSGKKTVLISSVRGLLLHHSLG